MKKLLLILLFLPLLFTTCKKEEENPTNNNINVSVPNMAGTWNATSLIFNGEEKVIPGLVSYSFIVRSDMTFSQYAYAFDGTSENQDGTWELSGSDLKINFVTGEFIHYYINSLTSTTASLNLVEYLNEGNSVYSNGSCNLVK